MAHRIAFLSRLLLIILAAVAASVTSSLSQDAERALEAWLGLFPGRFYLELQRLGRPFEETYIAGAIALAMIRQHAVDHLRQIISLVRRCLSSAVVVIAGVAIASGFVVA